MWVACYAQSKGYLWELSLIVDSPGHRTQFTFQKYPFLGPQMTTSAIISKNIWVEGQTLSLLPGRYAAQSKEGTQVGASINAQSLRANHLSTAFLATRRATTEHGHMNNFKLHCTPFMVK
jgi:hypothetical protein